MEVCVMPITLRLHALRLSSGAYSMHLRINLSASHGYKYLRIIVTNSQHKMLWQKF